MSPGLYNKVIKCPVCKIEFEVTKLTSGANRVLSKDTDFCVYYEGLNPIFYDIWVCENCGYANQSAKYETITDKDIKLVSEFVSPNWVKRRYSGERDIETALETFKLALFNLQIRKAKPNEFARVYIRIAWLFRLKEDPREKDFMRFALKYYSDIFINEGFPVDNLDECTCMYMIGELNRRTDNYEESSKWFSRIISLPKGKSDPKILDIAREQIQLVKDQLRKSEKQNEQVAEDQDEAKISD